MVIHQADYFLFLKRGRAKSEIKVVGLKYGKVSLASCLVEGKLQEGALVINPFPLSVSARMGLGPLGFF